MPRKRPVLNYAAGPDDATVEQLARGAARTLLLGTAVLVALATVVFLVVRLVFGDK